jgi:hypothetical protein
MMDSAWIRERIQIVAFSRSARYPLPGDNQARENPQPKKNDPTPLGGQVD